MTNIDHSRVYATGLSNGGAMSQRIACDAADFFAATAPVSYPLDFLPLSKCVPSRPISVSHYHGFSDVVVPYDGGAFSVPVVDSFAQWRDVTGCVGPAERTLVVKSAGSVVIYY